MDFKFGITSDNEDLTIAFAKTVIKKGQWKYADFFNPLEKPDRRHTDLFFSSHPGRTWSDCPDDKREETYFFSRSNVSEGFKMFNLPEDWESALKYVDYAYSESQKIELTMDEAIGALADMMGVSCRRIVIKPEPIK